MKKLTLKNWLLLILLLCGLLCFAVGCSNENSDTTEETNAADGALDGQSLFIYCGAGMTDPAEELVALFEEQTGADVEITFGNAAQLISQITTSGTGDLFIAGDQGDLEKIEEEYVTDVKPLVKHIPVIAVQEGNPKNITGLKDFANEGVKVVLGDNESTPIGKLSDKALEKAGVLDKINIVARSATAPEIANVLSLGECDATILWKENTNVDGIEIVDSPDMEAFIKTIPAATLKCSTNTDALQAFLEFLDTSEAKAIWENNGYELVEE